MSDGSGSRSHVSIVLHLVEARDSGVHDVTNAPAVNGMHGLMRPRRWVGVMGLLEARLGIGVLGLLVC